MALMAGLVLVATTLLAFHIVGRAVVVEMNGHWWVSALVIEVIQMSIKGITGMQG